MPGKRKYVSKRGGKKTTKKPARRNTSVAKLAKQVRTLSRNFKPELKNMAYTNGNININVGQVIQNSAGFYAYDVTPIMSQGVTVGSRLGSDIRLKSLNWRFQAYSQSATAQPIGFKVYIFRNTGAPITAASFVAEVFQTNPFIYTTPGNVNAGIIDYNSNINDDYKGNYQLLAFRRYTLKTKDYSAALVSQVNSTVKVYFKTPLRISFDANTNNIMKNQLFAVILCNSGNASATANTTGLTGIPVTGMNTGMWLNTNTEFKYYDD